MFFRFRRNEDVVDSNQFHLVKDHLFGAVTNGHHGDDRRNAKDYAQGSEDRPEFIQENGFERDVKNVFITFQHAEGNYDLRFSVTRWCTGRLFF